MDATLGGVVLRRLRASDRDAFLKAAGRSVRLHRPWSHPPRTEQEFDHMISSRRPPTGESLVVLRESDGEMAGYFGLGQIFYGHFRSAYLGYYAFVPLAGHGYMREGLQLLLDHAFHDLRLHRIQASIQPANLRSIDLVRGAGFVKEGFGRRYLKIGGRWRDHEHWALLAEDRKRLKI